MDCNSEEEFNKRLGEAFHAQSEFRFNENHDPFSVFDTHGFTEMLSRFRYTDGADKMCAPMEEVKKTLKHLHECYTPHFKDLLANQSEDIIKKFENKNRPSKLNITPNIFTYIGRYGVHLGEEMVEQIQFLITPLTHFEIIWPEIQNFLSSGPINFTEDNMQHLFDRNHLDAFSTFVPFHALCVAIYELLDPIWTKMANDHKAQRKAAKTIKNVEHVLVGNEKALSTIERQTSKSTEELVSLKNFLNVLMRGQHENMLVLTRSQQENLLKASNEQALALAGLQQQVELNSTIAEGGFEALCQKLNSLTKQLDSISKDLYHLKPAKK